MAKRHSQLPLASDAPQFAAPVQTLTSKEQGAGSREASQRGQVVQYFVGSEEWRCERFDLLTAEFDMPPVTPATLPLWHSLAVTQALPWLIVRRLFGLLPVLIPAATDERDLRTWAREELATELGKTVPQLRLDLEGLRGLWASVGRVSTEPGAGSKEIVIPPPKGQVELSLGDHPLLKEFNFTVAFTSPEERGFFLGRVQVADKLLRERMTAGVARNWLMTELQLKRIDEVLANPNECRPGSSEWRSNMKERGALSEMYGKQTEQLEKLAPWAKAIGGKYVGAGVLSDVTQCLQEYHATGDTSLRDGMFTAMEIDVECRRSVQAPLPRYRAGVVFYSNVARAGLFDPKFGQEKEGWFGGFPKRVFKILDAGWHQRAIEADAGNKLVDLESDGPDGEFSDLKAETSGKMPEAR